MEYRTNPAIAENRCGVFELSRNVVLYAPADVLAIFLSNFIIVKAELDLMTNCIAYGAYSMLFAPISPAELPPKYDALELLKALYGDDKSWENLIDDAKYPEVGE